MAAQTESLKEGCLKVDDFCVCFTCGQARMKLYYSSGERIGARCRTCGFNGIFLEDKLVAVSRKVFGQRMQEIALITGNGFQLSRNVVGT